MHANCTTFDTAVYTYMKIFATLGVANWFWLLVGSMTRNRFSTARCGLGDDRIQSAPRFLAVFLREDC